MDVQEIVGQFVKGAAEDPEQLKNFGIEPGRGHQERHGPRG